MARSAWQLVSDLSTIQFVVQSLSGVASSVHAYLEGAPWPVVLGAGLAMFALTSFAIYGGGLLWNRWREHRVGTTPQDWYSKPVTERVATLSEKFESLRQDGRKIIVDWEACPLLGRVFTARLEFRNRSERWRDR